MSKTSRMIASAATVLAILPMTIHADGPKFTGYVTGTYNYDLNDPASGANPGTNYYGGKTGSFQLNAAHLTISGGDSAGATYTVDLDGGTDGTHNTGVIHSDSAGGWAFDVQQAFVTVPFAKSPVSLTAGKFYTSEGIEVLNSAANPTVTRGLLFGQLEPVAHTGAYVTFKANDQISASIGGVNGWDNWQISPTDGIPFAYAKVALAFGDPFGGTISAYYGPYQARDNLLSLDLTGVTKVVPNLAINFQANYLSKAKLTVDTTNGSMKDWTGLGFGLQPVYTAGSAQVGLRYEFLSVDPGVGTSTTYNSISIAPGYKLTQSSLLRLEYRIDLASEKVFSDDKGAGTKNDQAVTAELNYTF